MIIFFNLARWSPHLIRPPIPSFRTQDTECQVSGFPHLASPTKSNLTVGIVFIMPIGIWQIPTKSNLAVGQVTVAVAVGCGLDIVNKILM